MRRVDLVEWVESSRTGGDGLEMREILLSHPNDLVNADRNDI